MAVGSFLWLVLHVLPSHGSLVSADGQCNTLSKKRVADHMVFIQKAIGVTKKHKQLSRESSPILSLHLKKEHIWSLAQQNHEGKEAEHLDIMADQIMVLMFHDKLQHLSSAEKAQLRQGISNAARTNDTRWAEMGDSLCVLDNIGHVHSIFDKLVKSPGDGQTNDKQMPADKQGLSIQDSMMHAVKAAAKAAEAASQSLKNVVSSMKPSVQVAESVKHAIASITPGYPSSYPEQAAVPAVNPAIPNKTVDSNSHGDKLCGNFAGKWQQDKQSSKSAFTSCEEYSVDVVQKGCSLNATSEDAWWGPTAHVEAVGNTVTVKASRSTCDLGSLFEATLSEDGNTAAWSDGCTWTRVPPGFFSSHVLLLLSIAGVVVAVVAYAHYSSPGS